MKTRVILIFVVITALLHADQKIKVSCIGNSITEGNMGGAYPTFLQTLLGSEYQVENHGVTSTTLLKKGDKPYWTHGKLNQVFNFKPDIITIKLGTNDTKSINWDLYHEEFKDDYLSMIDTLTSLSSKPDIYLVLPVPVFKTAYGIRDSILEKIIVIIKDIGEQRDLQVIDANTPLLNFGEYFADGIHPNDAGSDTIAHVIYNAIKGSTATIRSTNVNGLSSYENRQKRGCLKVFITSNTKFSRDINLIDLNGRFLGNSTVTVTSSGIRYIHNKKQTHE